MSRYIVTDSDNEAHGMGEVVEIVALNPHAAAAEYAEGYLIDADAELENHTMRIIVRWGRNDTEFRATIDPETREVTLQENLEKKPSKRPYDLQGLDIHEQ